MINHPNIDFNIKNNNGWTLFTQAIRALNKEIVQILINRANIKKSEMMGTLMHAITYSESKILKFFIDQVKIDFNKEEKQALLKLAKATGKREITNMIKTYIQQ